MTDKHKTKDEDDDQYNHFQVIVQPKPDLATQKVFCVYCQSQMKFLPGMPQDHGQWLCTSCGSMAYEGYGDTPAHDSDYKTLAITNDPYPTLEGSQTRALLKDIPTDDEIDMEEKKEILGRIDSKTGDGRRRRYGMRYAFMSAEEATKQI